MANAPPHARHVSRVICEPALANDDAAYTVRGLGRTPPGLGTITEIMALKKPTAPLSKRQRWRNKKFSKIGSPTPNEATQKRTGFMMISMLVTWFLPYVYGKVVSRRTTGVAQSDRRWLYTARGTEIRFPPRAAFKFLYMSPTSIIIIIIIIRDNWLSFTTFWWTRHQWEAKL